MGKRSRNFKLNNNKKKKEKPEIKKVDGRIIGWIGNEIPVVGSESLAMNEFRENDMSPIITNSYKYINYSICAIDKFPIYKENNISIWGEETSRQLINVFPQRKKTTI